MGKKLFFQTEEDRLNFSLFEDLFQKSSLQNLGAPIPKIIHLIWLGSKEYPKQSRSYLEKWHHFHPDWQIKLWSDRIQKPLYPFITPCGVTPLILHAYQDLYEKTVCLGGKSDILRLLLLQKEGGLYADHDVECRKPFDSLHTKYPFYTSLLFPEKGHFLNRSILVKNSLIGSIANHPLLEKALEAMAKKLDPSIPLSTERTLSQSFLPFHETVVESAKTKTLQGVVLPAGYFLSQSKRLGVYAREDIAKTWHPDESSKIAYLERRLTKITKRLHFFMILCSFFLTLLFLLLWI